MSLSRKRQRELDRLKRQAEDLWEEQQEVLDRATALAREARRQAGNYAREEIQPRVRTAYETGAGSVRGVALSARERFVGDVVPAVTGAARVAVVRDRTSLVTMMMPIARAEVAARLRPDASVMPGKIVSSPL